MNYNVKSKIDKINELESNQKAKAMIESAALQEKPTPNAHISTTNQESSDENSTAHSKLKKKNVTFCINEALIPEIETFLQKFGKAGESKSSFVQDALRYYLVHRKNILKQELEAKLAEITAQS